MSIVIKIENLYKEYRLGVIGHGTLYRDLQSWSAKIRGKEDPNSLIGQNNGKVSDHILAVNGVNLEVKEGEILGIIGRNGAGKSTLLKILSRVTAPTKGSIKIKGRLAALLEVGTGFHSELTGRENVYLNGAINGMTRKEVSSKLDEIVDFAGVGQFLDTPVKRYSSGMHVRLGFSVAAHLDPEILIVDEVLAVGDAAFQKKCIGKMSLVAKEGRTILFVSHQMQAISNLCNRAILLDKGRVLDEGHTDYVVGKYLEEKTTGKPISLKERKDRQGNGAVRLIDTWIEDDCNKKVSQILVGSQISICAKYQVVNRANIIGLITAFALNSIQNIQISDLSNITTDNELDLPEANTGIIRCVIRKFPLNVGIYTYNIMVRNKNGDVIDYLSEAGRLDVVEGDYFGTGKIQSSDRLVMIEHTWEISPYGDQKA
jgi:lipopolysaccharide transport system ATP-binding protein